MSNKSHRAKTDLTPFLLRLRVNIKYPAGIFRVENINATLQQKFIIPIVVIKLKRPVSTNLIFNTDKVFFDTVKGQSYTGKVFFDTVEGQMYTDQVFSDTVVGQTYTGKVFFDTVVGQTYTGKVFFDTVEGQMYTDKVFFDTVVGKTYTDKVYKFRIKVKMIEKQQNARIQEDLKYYYQTILISYITRMNKLAIQKRTDIHTFRRNIG